MGSIPLNNLWKTDISLTVISTSETCLRGNKPIGLSMGIDRKSAVRQPSAASLVKLIHRKNDYRVECSETFFDRICFTKWALNINNRASEFFLSSSSSSSSSYYYYYS